MSQQAIGSEASGPVSPCMSRAISHTWYDAIYADQSEHFDPELWLYRERTVALLRRYLRISVQVGRLPSLLGRELFRSKVTSYCMASFEDGIIFVHDVERALDRLDTFARRLIVTIIFQEYTQDEAAELLRCARRTICRELPAALDRMSEIFLEGGLLNQLPDVPVEKVCQGDESTGPCLSGCNEAE